jgi:hypothetical protein
MSRNSNICDLFILTREEKRTELVGSVCGGVSGGGVTQEEKEKSGGWRVLSSQRSASVSCAGG